jgi:hypothetical protein
MEQAGLPDLASTPGALDQVHTGLIFLVFPVKINLFILSQDNWISFLNGFGLPGEGGGGRGGMFNR